MKKYTFEYEVVVMGEITIKAETETEAKEEAQSVVEDGYWVDKGQLTSVIIT